MANEPISLVFLLPFTHVCVILRKLKANQNIKSHEDDDKNKK